MTVLTMKFIYRSLLALTAIITLPVFAAELKVHDYWVAAAPAVATSQAAYICFINDGDKDVKIVGVSAKGFGKATLHQSMQHGDMVMMQSLESLVVPAHKMVTLEPGAMHIMLTNPDKIAAVGEKVMLTVEYDDKTRQVVELEVKATAAKATEHKDHNVAGKANAK